MKKENYRGRAYRRFQRNRAIRRKKGLSRRIYGMGWFQIDGKYSKGHIGCGCWLCKPGKRFREASWEDARKTERCKCMISEWGKRLERKTLEVFSPNENKPQRSSSQE